MKNKPLVNHQSESWFNLHQAESLGAVTGNTHHLDLSVPEANLS